MKFSVRFIVGMLCVLYAAHAFAAQPPWPKIDKALAAWQGDKEMLLVSPQQNPLESPAVQKLLEQILMHGFAVRTGNKVVSNAKGLILELRDSSGGELIFCGELPMVPSSPSNAALRQCSSPARLRLRYRCRQSSLRGKSPFQLR